jgi:hypothetical protein
MVAFSVEQGERAPLLVVALLAGLMSVALAAVSWSLADNHFMFPLDDAYIHLQYAKQLAAGQPLIYTPGANLSGGMTSPLFVLLLAPAFLVGLSGAKGAAFSFLLCTAIWVLGNVWLHQFVRRLFEAPLLAWLASALLLGNGHAVWTYHSGMETGLMATLYIGVALAAHTWWTTQATWARLTLFALLALLPLVRPEGLLAIGAVGLVVLLRKGDTPRLSLFTLALCVVPFLFWLATLQVATGSWKPAGATVKSLLSAPFGTPAQKLALVGETLSALSTRYFWNLSPHEGWSTFKGRDHFPYFPLGVPLLMLVGFGFSLAGERLGNRSSSPMLVALLWLLALLAVATSIIPFTHHARYVAPAIPLGIALACVAVRRVCQLFQQLEIPAQRAFLAGALVAALPSLGYWIPEHGRNARDIYHVLRVATFRLQQHDTSLAYTDAGVLAYYTPIKGYDLVGLGSSEFTAAAAHGPGATLETLASLPHASRPLHVLTYPMWLGDDFPLKQPLWSVSIPRTTIAWGTHLELYPIDWERIDAARAPQGRVLAEVNVADLQSERAASYRHRIGPYDLPDDLLGWGLTPSVTLPLTVSEVDSATTSALDLKTVVEGGRLVRGESYELHLDVEPFEAMVLRVRVGRSEARELRLRIKAPNTGAFEECRFALPIEGGEATVRVGELLRQVGGMDPFGGFRYAIEMESGPDSGASWMSCRHRWEIPTGPAEFDAQ